MRLRFNEKKATQAAAQFLRLSAGHMNYMKLVKLLYIVDREALLRWGRPVTTDAYFSMQHGPVLSQVLDLITEGPNPFVGDTFWTQHISEPEHHEVSLKDDPADDQLSEAEEELIQQAFTKFGKFNQWELVDVVHNFPEWKDPEGSATPIDYADILKAENRAPEEIRAIESDLDAVNRVDQFFQAR